MLTDIIIIFRFQWFCTMYSLQTVDLSPTRRFGSLALVGIISLLIIFSLLFELLIWLDFDGIDNWLVLICDFDANDVI